MMKKNSEEKNSDRVPANKTRHLPVENELRKITKFDAPYFRGKEYLGTDGLQNYLVFKND